MKDQAIYRGTRQRTGFVSSSSIYGKPRLGWEFKSRSYKISTTPSVWRERVFFSNLGYRNTFHCLDAVSGEVLWKFDAGRGSSSSPMVVDSIVYFGTRDGRLLGLDAETGRQVWQFYAGEVVASSPVIVDDTIYFGSGAFSALDTNGYVHAVDLASGEERWRFAAPKGWWNRGFRASPSVDQGVVCCGCQSGEFFALDSQTGKLLWVNEPILDESEEGRPMFNLSNSTPIAQNTVYFIRNPYLYAVDLFTGAERWRFKFSAGYPLFTAKQAFGHDTVYLGGYTGEVFVFYAVDARTGIARWVHQPEQVKGGIIFSEPVIAGNVVCTGTGRSFFGFDAYTGEEIWRFDADDKDAGTWTSASVQANRLYIAAPFAHKVYCLEFKN